MENLRSNSNSQNRGVSPGRRKENESAVGKIWIMIQRDMLYYHVALMLRA